MGSTNTFSYILNNFTTPRVNALKGAYSLLEVIFWSDWIFSLCSLISSNMVSMCLPSSQYVFISPLPWKQSLQHDDDIKWKWFPRYWPFVRGIHRSPVNSPHKGQWRGALIFSLICAWINGWVNNRVAGDLRCHHAHYDVILMELVRDQGGISKTWARKSVPLEGYVCVSI